MPLVAENFLLAAETASKPMLRRESNLGYTTLVVGVTYATVNKHYYFTFHP
jgi:hypothetical protein